MDWNEAFKILKPFTKNGYVSGDWPKIRYQKIGTLFALAKEVPENSVIVDLGTYHGLTAAAMALGAPTSTVHSFDDYDTRRSEPVAGIGWTFSEADYQAFLENMALLPEDVRARIVQHKTELVQGAEEWKEQNVALLSWDIWGERLYDDVKAWSRHIRVGGIIAVKAQEDGSFKHERIYDLEGFEPYKENPAGLIYSVRRNA